MELTPPSKTAKSLHRRRLRQPGQTKDRTVPALIASIVRFTPGARKDWYSHTLGQTLFCTDGAGLVVSATAPSSASPPATPSGPRPMKSTGTAPAPTA
jgi:hypothetical protein